MTTIFDEVKAEGLAQGVVQGLAQGEARATVAVLRDLVDKGILSVDAARAEIHSLVAKGTLPPAVGTEAISRLG